MSRPAESRPNSSLSRIRRTFSQRVTYGALAAFVALSSVGSIRAQEAPNENSPSDPTVIVDPQSPEPLCLNKIVSAGDSISQDDVIKVAELLRYRTQINLSSTPGLQEFVTNMPNMSPEDLSTPGQSLTIYPHNNAAQSPPGYGYRLEVADNRIIPGNWSSRVSQLEMICSPFGGFFDAKDKRSSVEFIVPFDTNNLMITDFNQIRITRDRLVPSQFRSLVKDIFPDVPPDENWILTGNAIYTPQRLNPRTFMESMSSLSTQSNVIIASELVTMVQ